MQGKVAQNQEQRKHSKHTGARVREVFNWKESVQSCYNAMLDYDDAWIICIRNELFNLGLGYIWNEKSVNKYSFKIIEQRLLDVHK